MTSISPVNSNVPGLLQINFTATSTGNYYYQIPQSTVVTIASNTTNPYVMIKNLDVNPPNLGVINQLNTDFSQSMAIDVLPDGTYLSLSNGNAIVTLAVKASYDTITAYNQGFSSYPPLGTILNWLYTQGPLNPSPAVINNNVLVITATEINPVANYILGSANSSTNVFQGAPILILNAYNTPGPGSPVSALTIYNETYPSGLGISLTNLPMVVTGLTTGNYITIGVPQSAVLPSREGPTVITVPYSFTLVTG